jgi:hypothetical protein
MLDRFFRLSDVPGLGVRCSPEGLFVGQTQLLERVCIQNGRLEWRVRPAGAIERDLGKNYGMPIEVSAKMSGIAAVARALDDEDIVQAQITALLLEFPDPPEAIESNSDPFNIVDLAKRLHASNLLNRDWDPAKHPRWPAQSADGIGGQFAPSDSVADGSKPDPAVTTQAQVTIPFPLDIPAPGTIPFPFEILPPPLVAPNILPRSLPQNPYPGRPECVKEWQEAFTFCWRLKINGQLGRGASRGMGRTLRDCMLGQVSESCGGNAATI